MRSARKSDARATWFIGNGNIYAVLCRQRQHKRWTFVMPCSKESKYKHFPLVLISLKIVIIKIKIKK